MVEDTCRFFDQDDGDSPVDSTGMTMAVEYVTPTPPMASIKNNKRYVEGMLLDLVSSIPSKNIRGRE